MKYIQLLFLVVVLTLTSCAQTTNKSTNNSNKEKPTTQYTGTIKQINATALKNLLEKEKIQLIDVRTPAEYKAGRIAEAKNINIYDKKFTEQIQQLNKETSIYVYCRSGVRSMKAAHQLKKEGFNVVNLSGGIKGWLSKKFEIKK